MSRLCLYFKPLKEKDRWLPGDRFLRPFVRRILRGKPRIGGVDKVFVNLCKGLDLLQIPYVVNLPFSRLRPDDRVAVLGRGYVCLEGYRQKNPIVAGIGLMTHPAEWPDLCEKYPVVRYLQHSAWCNEIYKPYYGDKCDLWPVGIETERWKPNPAVRKDIDLLIYNKVSADYANREADLLNPLRNYLADRNLSSTEFRYGTYNEPEFYAALLRSRAMIFLSDHESQGIACHETLSTNVPVFAWDQGKWLDPNRFRWGTPEVKATSVPFFDERCGDKFRDFAAFEQKFDLFWQKVESRAFQPRSYILENLTLEKCARHFVDIVNRANA